MSKAKANESKCGQVSICLIHYPVMDRAKNIVATNVTNFDIHDIARAARTYGIKRYAIVTNVKEQLMFVHRVLDHWLVGMGSQFNPYRKKALRLIETSESLETLVKTFSKRPVLVGTSAKTMGTAKPVTFAKMKQQIADLQPDDEVLLVFGTGYGLPESELGKLDYLLEPISGPSPDGFNHLSVRSAVSICLDRLLA